jgi:hypothetical protein
MTYTFVVTATNQMGSSPRSAPSNPVQVETAGAIITQYDAVFGQPIDVATGFALQPDGSEIDFNDGTTVVPAPASLPPVATFGPETYLLTQDPVSGLYTTFHGTTVDLSSDQETDAYGNVLGVPDFTTLFLVTTVDTLVAVDEPYLQLNPVTLAPVSANLYVVAPTPAEFQINAGPPMVQ